MMMMWIGIAIGVVVAVVVGGSWILWRILKDLNNGVG